MSYQTALFCQFLESELRNNGSLRARVRRALKRLSPTITLRQLRIYVDALIVTIAPSGRLRPDWKERLYQEH